MAVTNNNLNNSSSTSVASTTQTFTVSNSDNTSTSAAAVNISVGGGTTTGDPQTSYIITGATTWSVGADNSISDQFTIAASATLGTSNTQTISTTGVVQWPSQPAFLAYLGTSDTNATGNGLAHQYGSGNAMTVIFDRASNFNTNGTFTAPVTGQYYLAGNAELSNTTTCTGIEVQIITTAYTYSNRLNIAFATAVPANSIATIASMTAGDTATFSVIGFGEAGNTETVDGASGGLINFFTGYLLG